MCAVKLPSLMHGRSALQASEAAPRGHVEAPARLQALPVGVFQREFRKGVPFATAQKHHGDAPQNRMVILLQYFIVSS